MERRTIEGHFEYSSTALNKLFLFFGFTHIIQINYTDLMECSVQLHFIFNIIDQNVSLLFFHLHSKLASGKKIEDFIIIIGLMIQLITVPKYSCNNMRLHRHTVPGL